MVEDVDVPLFNPLQVQTSTETQVSQVLLVRGVSQERPTPCPVLVEPQDKKGSEEFQVRPDTSNITICITRNRSAVGWPEWERYEVMLVRSSICPLNGVSKRPLRMEMSKRPQLHMVHTILAIASAHTTSHYRDLCHTACINIRFTLHAVQTLQLT